MAKSIVVHTGRKPTDQIVEEMEALDAPDVIVYKRGPCSTPAQVLEAVRDADVGLCGREPYTEEVFAGAPNLKMVIRYGVGVDTAAIDSAGYDAAQPDSAGTDVAEADAASLDAARPDRFSPGETGWQ